MAKKPSHQSIRPAPIGRQAPSHSSPSCVPFAIAVDLQTGASDGGGPRELLRDLQEIVGEWFANWNRPSQFPGCRVLLVGWVDSPRGGLPFEATDDVTGALHSMLARLIKRKRAVEIRDDQGRFRFFGDLTRPEHSVILEGVKRRGSSIGSELEGIGAATSPIESLEQAKERSDAVEKALELMRQTVKGEIERLVDFMRTDEFSALPLREKQAYADQRREQLLAVGYRIKCPRCGEPGLPRVVTGAVEVTHGTRSTHNMKEHLKVKPVKLLSAPPDRRKKARGK